jgi:hypothetical protein
VLKVFERLYIAPYVRSFAIGCQYQVLRVGDPEDMDEAVRPYSLQELTSKLKAQLSEKFNKAKTEFQDAKKRIVQVVGWGNIVHKLILDVGVQLDRVEIEGGARPMTHSMGGGRQFLLSQSKPA